MSAVVAPAGNSSAANSGDCTTTIDINTARLLAAFCMRNIYVLIFFRIIAGCRKNGLHIIRKLVVSLAIGLLEALCANIAGT